ncbi:MAG: VOC family protein [Planctomycetota bacterium]
MFNKASITINCSNTKQSDFFYREVLGAILLPSDGYGCAWYSLGEMTISLMPNASDACPADYSKHALAHLYLETDDLASVHDRIKSLSIKILEWHPEEFMIISDPDQIPIEIWQKSN